jgi:uncharacterized protein YpmB
MVRKKRKVVIISILIIVTILLIATFYISKITNKPCIHVEIDCKEFQELQPNDECITHYNYCGPEALLDLIIS